MYSKPTAIVIGAGIVGLALTRALFNKGWKVTVIERNPRPQGASVRNFGMIWPVGQPQGMAFDRAMRSREIWIEMSRKANFSLEETGSLHLTYSDLELQVAEEYVAAVQGIKSGSMLTVKEVQQKSNSAKLENLKGGLWTSEELIIDPREAIDKVATYLESLEDIQLIWNRAVNRIHGDTVFSGQKKWTADRIFVSSGADFETLYPEIFEQTDITKCKLQMLRICKQPDNWRMGPPLCSGLSFIHYKGFQVAPSLEKLRAVYAEEYPELMKWGIHVMVAQNGLGELTIGDSHEYGLNPSPFDKSSINELILAQLKKFAEFKSWELDSTWQGVYPKMMNGATEFIRQVDDQVTIVNGLGGNGMTLSFGLAEELIAKLV